MKKVEKNILCIKDIITHIVNNIVMNTFIDCYNNFVINGIEHCNDIESGDISFKIDTDNFNN